MKISKSVTPMDITIDNTKVKQAKEFKYLGSIFFRRWKTRQRNRNKVPESKHSDPPTFTITSSPKDQDGNQKTDNIYNLYTNTLLLMSNMVVNNLAAEENRYM